MRLKSALNRIESRVDAKVRHTPHYVAACKAEDKRTAPDSVAGWDLSVMPA